MAKNRFKEGWSQLKKETQVLVPFLLFSTICLAISLPFLKIKQEKKPVIIGVEIKNPEGLAPKLADEAKALLLKAFKDALNEYHRTNGTIRTQRVVLPERRSTAENQYKPLFPEAENK